MRFIEKATNIEEQGKSLSEFLVELDNELSNLIDELLEAEEGNAVEVCKSAADKLDKYYQQL